MSSKRATAEAVATLYTAAGRNYADVELRLYHSTLANITDDELAEAVDLIVRRIDWRGRAPSPALILETVRSVKYRRDLGEPVKALPPAPPSEKDRAKVRGHVAAAREALNQQKESA